ncbi:sensor histidine kinase [Roseateles sp.]|uniref:sensor histidine kinase n=1 Tax=Roseateles sp. TaxID=1971397 RepID=UPI00392F9360
MALFSKRRAPEDQPKTSIWRESIELSTLLGFAPTQVKAAPMPTLFDPGREFDVCHVGLVLRAVLGVQACLALGTAMASQNLGQWFALLSTGTVVTMFGLLTWLLAVCGFKRVLGRLGEGGQWLLLTGLGALCGLFGWVALDAVSVIETTNFRLISVALCGASVGGVMLAWLKLRERTQRPANALAQLVELQSRIRPHFLFNTLNSAIALVQIDPARAESVLEDLAELFRVALADASASVSLEEEIDLARRYLAIEQIRFGKRLRITWRLDPAAKRARVPPLLLQPLVENAVRHGVEPNEEGGELEIITNQKGSEVEIRITNTVGQPTKQPGHGLALPNVRQRLHLLHDVAAVFDVDAKPDRYSLRIVVPLR